MKIPLFAYWAYDRFETELTNAKTAGPALLEQAITTTQQLERILMNDYIHNFNSRLQGIFEIKAQEFTKYSEENPSTAVVASQLAGLYADLAALMKG